MGFASRVVVFGSREEGVVGGRRSVKKKGTRGW